MPSTEAKRGSFISIPCKNCGGTLPFDASQSTIVCQHCHHQTHIGDQRLFRIRHYLRSLKQLEEKASLAMTNKHHQKKLRSILRNILLPIACNVVFLLLALGYGWVHRRFEEAYGVALADWVSGPLGVIGFLLAWAGWAYVLTHRRKEPFHFSAGRLASSTCADCGALIPMILGQTNVVCPFCQTSLIPDPIATTKAEEVAGRQVNKIQDETTEETKKTARLYQKWSQIGQIFVTVWLTTCFGSLVGVSIFLSIDAVWKVPDLWTGLIMLGNFALWIVVGTYIAQYKHKKAMVEQIHFEQLTPLQKTHHSQAKKESSILKHMFIVPTLAVAFFTGLTVFQFRSFKQEQNWLKTLPEGMLALKASTPALWKGVLMGDAAQKTPLGQPAVAFLTWLSYAAGKNHYTGCVQTGQHPIYLRTTEGSIPIKIWGDALQDISIFEISQGALRSNHSYHLKVDFGKEVTTMAIPTSVQNACAAWMNRKPIYHEVSIPTSASIEIMACLENQQLVPCPQKEAILSVHPVKTMVVAEARDWMNMMRWLVILFGTMFILYGLTMLGSGAARNKRK